MQFTELLDALARDGDAFSVAIPDDWMQGRSAFGGLQVALAVRAMRSLVPELPLRTLQATFAGPIDEGGYRVRVKTLRTGKSTVFVEARVGGPDEVATVVVAVFGRPRSSVVTVTPRMPELAPDQRTTLPFLPGITPSFTQHFVATWRNGALPFSGTTETRAVVEASMREGPATTESRVIALADLVPPLGLSFLRTPAPGSSSTWQLGLLRDRFDDLGEGPCRVDVELIAARDGYTSQSLTLWGPSGEPLALGTQSMTVFG